MIPIEQKVEELASFSLEIKRIPDPYWFEVDDDGDLFSPSGRKKIKDVIIRDDYIGRSEGAAFDFINQRVKENKDNPNYEAVFAWVSGPYQGVYNDLKVVISEIKGKGRERKMFNTAIIFDFNGEQSWDFVNRLASWDKNNSSPVDLEQVRITPFILDTSDAHWTDILQSVVGKADLWDFIRREDDKRAKQEALRQSRLVYERFLKGNEKLEDLLIASSLLGSNRPHCPANFRKSAFQTFFGNSLVVDFRSNDPDYCIHCGACGVEINQVVRQGEKCPAGCGATREC